MWKTIIKFKIHHNVIKAKKTMTENEEYFFNILQISLMENIDLFLLYEK